MKSTVFGAAQTFNRLRANLNVGSVHAGARRPFRFLLCGDPSLLGSFRYVMLSGLKGPFVVGTTVPLVLQFDGGEPAFTVQMEVKPLDRERPKPH